MLLCSHSFSSRAVGLHAFLPSLATLALALCTPSAHAQMPRIELSAGLNRIEAEVAANMSDRMQGLMHRQSLPANHGMLFVYPQAQTHCMWMRNTLIPLSVAFLDDSGRINNIADMKPHSEENHCAAAPARFALEMNKGWFSSKGIRPGQKISGLDKTPPPR